MLSHENWQNFAKFIEPFDFALLENTKFSRQTKNEGHKLIISNCIGVNNSFILLTTPNNTMEWFAISSKERPHLQRDCNSNVKYAYDCHGNTHIFKVYTAYTNDINDDLEEVQSFHTEKKILQQLNNLIAYGYRTIGKKTKFYIIQKYIPGLTLEKLCSPASDILELNLQTQCIILVNILQEILYLHNRHLISHQDLHSRNILIESSVTSHKLKINLIDYSLSTTLETPLAYSKYLEDCVLDYNQIGDLLIAHFNIYQLYTSGLLPNNFHLKLKNLDYYSSFSTLIQTLSELNSNFNYNSC